MIRNVYNACERCTSTCAAGAMSSMNNLLNQFRVVENVHNFFGEMGISTCTGAV